jgi:hypothetical protein
MQTVNNSRGWRPFVRAAALVAFGSLACGGREVPTEPGTQGSGSTGTSSSTSGSNLPSCTQMGVTCSAGCIASQARRIVCLTNCSGPVKIIYGGCHPKDFDPIDVPTCAAERATGDVFLGPPGLLLGDPRMRPCTDEESVAWGKIVFGRP